MLVKRTKALKKKVRRHIGFHPTLKLARPCGTRERPRKAPVRVDRAGVRSLERRYPYDIAVPMQKRLQDGHECYALQNDAGEFESFIWIVSGHGLYAAELGTYIWVPENVAYLYDAFTWPESRGRGSFTELVRGIVATFGSSNPLIERFEAWVDRGNRASFRALQKANFRVCGSYTAAIVGPVRLFTGRPWIEDLGNDVPNDGLASAREQR